MVVLKKSKPKDQKNSTKIKNPHRKHQKQTAGGRTLSQIVISEDLIGNPAPQLPCMQGANGACGAKPRGGGFTGQNPSASPQAHYKSGLFRPKFFFASGGIGALQALGVF